VRFSSTATNRKSGVKPPHSKMKRNLIIAIDGPSGATRAGALFSNEVFAAFV
jgi:hypothetical protein